jgi:hypothetical protein
MGLAVEQAFGSWLINLTGIVAERATQHVEDLRMKLGTQFTALGAVGYGFDNEATATFVASYAFNGNATINGKEVEDSGRRLLRLSGSGSHPINDHLRLQGSVFVDPPVFLTKNQITIYGITFTMIYSWF